MSTHSQQTRPKPFAYEKLESVYFRLFQLILPAEGETIDENAPITGRLISHNYGGADLNWHSFIASMKSDSATVMEALAGTEKFLALSYSWSANCTCPIFVEHVADHLDKDEKVVYDSERNGHVYVSPSAQEFLTEMRRQREKRFMWIDAICIDQSSWQDKSNQLPRMRDIYENADAVYIWLGRMTMRDEMALRTMPNVTSKLRDCKMTEHDSLEKAFASVGLPEPSHGLWKSYADILKRPWWSRLWTFQEVTMARDSDDGITYEGSYEAPQAFVWCGEVKYPWKDFDHFAEALAVHDLKAWLIAGREGVALSDLHGFDAIAEVRTARESKAVAGWAVALSALLCATRRRDASRPEDMVKGMSALLDASTRKELALETLSSPQEVFLRFAKHYIRNEPKECLLNHTSTQQQLPGLPSWCPNFASREETKSIGTRWYGHFQEPRWLRAQMPKAGLQKSGKWALPRIKLYYAKYVSNTLTAKHPLHGFYDTKNPRQIALVPDSDNILASGIHIDTVVEIVDCNAGADSSSFLSLESLEQTASWDDKCSSLARRTMTSASEESRSDLYARTITANRVVPSFSVSLPKSSLTWDDDDMRDKVVLFDHECQVDFAKLYVEFRSYIQATLNANPTTINKQTRDFAASLHLMSRRRRFFATKGGRIGLGPSDTQPGDEVVVLFYCPTPYLLRHGVEPKIAPWQLVGEAYVHGFMYGEALKMFDDGKLSETKWTIG